MERKTAVFNEPLINPTKKVGHSLSIAVLKMNRRPINSTNRVDVLQRSVVDVPRRGVFAQVNRP